MTPRNATMDERVMCNSPASARNAASPHRRRRRRASSGRPVLSRRAQRLRSPRARAGSRSSRRGSWRCGPSESGSRRPERAPPARARSRGRVTGMSRTVRRPDQSWSTSRLVRRWGNASVAYGATPASASSSSTARAPHARRCFGLRRHPESPPSTAGGGTSHGPVSPQHGENGGAAG